MVCSNIELAVAEIMAEDLQTHTNGYHLDIPGPSLTILMKTWSNFIIVLQNLEVSYN